LDDDLRLTKWTIHVLLSENFIAAASPCGLYLDNTIAKAKLWEHNWRALITVAHVVKRSERRTIENESVRRNVAMAEKHCEVPH